MDQNQSPSPLDPIPVNPVYSELLPEWNVLIRNAVTPWNFHATDYQNSKNLEDLESSMTSWYNDYSKLNTKALKFGDLEFGGFYAVSHSESGKWLRCEIIKPFRENLQMITVRLIDNGAIYTTIPENLLPLKESFRQLPVQAVEASLVDCSNSPNRHLTAEECHRFYKRVEGKSFYAYVLNSIESLKAREKVQLILVDTTSGDKNIYIHEEFELKLESTSNANAKDGSAAVTGIPVLFIRET